LLLLNGVMCAFDSTEVNIINNANNPNVAIDFFMIWGFIFILFQLFTALINSLS
jgi:hypothetical protein